MANSSNPTQKCSEGNTVTSEPKKKFKGKIQKSRLFCFTDYKMVEEFYDEDKLGFQWCLAGKEECPTTHRLHWQGVIYFKNQRSIQAMWEKFEGRSIRICKGNVQQNEVYCSKDGDIVIEKGNKPVQGKRYDLEQLRDDIIDGCTVDEIAWDNPDTFHQYGRTLAKLEDIHLRKKFRTEMTKGTWYYGETGVGKSHKAFEGYSPETHYIYPNDNGWWDGYTGQETVIINDFRGCIPYGELLQLVDKWPTHVRRRCREPSPFLSKHVIITSSLKPTDVYSNLAETDSLDQLLRRFEVIHMKELKKNDGAAEEPTYVEGVVYSI